MRREPPHAHGKPTRTAVPWQFEVGLSFLVFSVAILAGPWSLGNPAKLNHLSERFLGTSSLSMLVGTGTLVGLPGLAAGGIA